MLLEVYMKAGESRATEASRLLNAQAVNLDAADVSFWTSEVGQLIANIRFDTDHSANASQLVSGSRILLLIEVIP